MIKLENPDDIYNWDTTQLWNAVQSIPEPELQTYNQIKYGIKLKFPIWHITQEWYEIYPSHDKAKVLGIGKISLTGFMEEKEARDKLMRQLIEEELQTEGPTESRT